MLQALSLFLTFITWKYLVPAHVQHSIAVPGSNGVPFAPDGPQIKINDTIITNNTIIEEEEEAENESNEKTNENNSNGQEIGRKLVIYDD